MWHVEALELFKASFRRGRLSNKTDATSNLTNYFSCWVIRLWVGPGQTEAKTGLCKLRDWRGIIERTGVAVEFRDQDTHTHIRCICCCQIHASLKFTSHSDWTLLWGTVGTMRPLCTFFQCQHCVECKKNISSKTSWSTPWETLLFSFLLKSWASVAWRWHWKEAASLWILGDTLFTVHPPETQWTLTAWHSLYS